MAGKKEEMFRELKRILAKNEQMPREMVGKIMERMPMARQSIMSEEFAKIRGSADNLETNIKKSQNLMHDKEILEQSVNEMLPAEIADKRRQLESSWYYYFSPKSKKMVHDEIGKLEMLLDHARRHLEIYDSPSIIKEIQYQTRKPGLQMLEGTDWDRKNSIHHYLGDENVARDISSYLGGKRTKKSKRTNHSKIKRRNTFKKNKRHSKK